MTARLAPAESPPLGLVAPFFIVAPVGLIAAGLLLAFAGTETFVGINAPRTIAVTHALVLGWITTTMMGAIYQLGPAVLGGRLLSLKLARVQFVLHVVSLAVFVYALLEWRLVLMGYAAALLVVSFILFVLNAGTAVKRGREWTLTRGYVGTSLLLLCGAFSLGITWTGALHHLWFPVTLGRLSAHAHLGLVGWLGIMLMGVSYQLVPMFNVVNRVKPRLGWPALALTTSGVLVFMAVMLTDPAREARMAVAAFLVVGPVLWAIDSLRLILGRSRRRMDVQGRSTMVSLAFLALAAAMGMGAAWGTPLTTDEEPARWLLAYAAAGIVGWVGIAVVGNSYKILPFLIWFHRYRSRLGQGPVPVVGDIYSERVANGVMLLLALCAGVLLVASLSGNLDLLHAGGMVLAITGVVHMLGLTHMFLPKSATHATATSAAAQEAR